MTYREAMDRFGSDKPDLRFGIELTELTDYFTDTPFRVFQSPTWAPSSCPAAARSRAGVRRLAGLGEVPRRQGPRVRDDRRGRHPRRAGRQEHLRRRARGPGRGRRREARRLRVLRRRPAPVVAGAAGRRPQRDRQAARAHRARQLVVPVRRRLPDVRADRERRLDVHAPPVHLAHAGVAGEVRGEQGRGAVRRLRHGDQRQRGDERLGAYPRRRLQEKVFETLDVHGGGPRAVRVLPGGLRLRPAAARRCGDRLGPACALLSGVDSIREVIAFPKTGAASTR